MLIEGKLTKRAGFSIEKSADPKLNIGEIVWLEAKEPDFLRPMARSRWRVNDRIESGEVVHYHFDKLTNELDKFKKA